MADETFRQDRDPKSVTSPSGIKITGKIPPGLKKAIKMVRGQLPVEQQEGTTQARPQGSAALEELIENLRDKSHVYDEVILPSKGNFYDGQDGPTDGILHIRPMTGEEEQILATPRYVRKGQAINMIFQRCLQEHVRTEELLSTDRTFLLIWLRGISYGHEYEVEVKCPNCDKKFNHVIDLNALTVNDCPPSFKGPLEGTLPVSGYKFKYRLSRGRDENAVQEYRDKQLRMFGDSGSDDTLIYRTASLVEHIEGLKDKHELVMLLKKLPIQDVAYLRNLIVDPPFGVDTKVQIICASCLEEFEVDLPLEANFFFPRQRRTKASPPA